MLFDNFLHIDNEGNLHVDKKKEHSKVLVTHGHLDHIPTRFSNKDLICSDETRRMIELRRDRDNLKIKHDEKIELLPAGHTIGSMMFFLKDQKLLFTGDFSTQKRYCGVAKPIHTETLVMETTFGKNDYIFPNQELVKKQFIDYVKDNDKVSIAVYSFGKAQEICHILNEAKIPFAVDSGVKKINDALELFYEYQDNDSGVILTKDRLNGYKRVGLSGWAVKSSYKYQFGLDESFCLSDHNDFPSLIEFVQGCNPKKVYTYHGFHVEFAQNLRKIGFDAEPLLSKGQKMLKNY